MKLRILIVVVALVAFSAVALTWTTSSELITRPFKGGGSVRVFYVTKGLLGFVGDIGGLRIEVITQEGYRYEIWHDFGYDGRVSVQLTAENVDDGDAILLREKWSGVTFLIKGSH